MERKFLIFPLLIFILCLLASCGSGSAPVPEELIENPDSEPIEIKDQYELSIGETGYTVDLGNKNILEITLNSVGIVDEINGETAASNSHPERVYVVANFTVKNHGEIGISKSGLEYPVLVDGNNLAHIQNNQVTHRNDLIGIGDRIKLFEDAFFDLGPIEPGEELTGNMLIVADRRADSYILYFGYDRDYLNKLTWHFTAEEAE
ncbi:hypothetical protein H8S33_11025 [Ornithinibacillus sp. BX22]|uniref:DUF4352 domain-containing protein n=2 Tax=Ornithinibacillus TaxID=484508 RepID=A0A923L6I5_9BACI|nr:MULTISPECIES: hypothetical protein [Ornithinibacillus]MBC5637337.1 hypothetical protein [Ornithinibacillus hominis]MBS3680356.1 hypothetical protein [Ornithinibacillus massiliensis]